MDNLGEVSILKQELFNLYLKLSVRAHIQLVTMDNSSTCAICPPSWNGTNIQLQLCIFSGVVNIHKSDSCVLHRIQDLQRLVFADLL
jgi:hypothetical protein